MAVETDEKSVLFPPQEEKRSIIIASKIREFCRALYCTSEHCINKICHMAQTCEDIYLEQKSYAGGELKSYFSAKLHDRLNASYYCQIIAPLCLMDGPALMRPMSAQLQKQHVQNLTTSIFNLEVRHLLRFLKIRFSGP